MFGSLVAVGAIPVGEGARLYEIDRGTALIAVDRRRQPRRAQLKLMLNIVRSLIFAGLTISMRTSKDKQLLTVVSLWGSLMFKNFKSVYEWWKEIKAVIEEEGCLYSSKMSTSDCVRY